MATRFTSKPDPSIKKNVLRARASARTAKSAHPFVVAASIAATIFTWGLFSHQDEQMLAVQAANSNQPAIIVTAPTQSASVAPEVAAQAPVVLATTRSSR